jgi:hypothetical protein
MLYLDKVMKYQEFQIKTSEISKLDYEMTKEVLAGYRPYYGDKFQSHRDRILELRIELFPNSVWALGIKED